VTRFAAADGPPVEVGRYPGPLQMLGVNHPLSAKADALRADVESHEQVLRSMVRDRISVKSPLEFQFMYVAHDSADHQLILRYFSRAADQTDFAGWQVQLVYSLPSLQPVHAYVQALPLE
jgi:glutamate-1-semialdehyde aminotransferase